MLTVALIGTVTPFALPALLPILLLFYFLYSYFQASAGCPHPLLLGMCAFLGARAYLLVGTLHVRSVVQGGR